MHIQQQLLSMKDAKIQNPFRRFSKRKSTQSPPPSIPFRGEFTDSLSYPDRTDTRPVTPTRKVEVFVRQMYGTRHGEPAVVAESRQTIKIGPKKDYECVILELRRKAVKCMFYQEHIPVGIEGTIILELGHKDIEVYGGNWDQMRRLLLVSDAILRYDFTLVWYPHTEYPTEKEKKFKKMRAKEEKLRLTTGFCAKVRSDLRSLKKKLEWNDSEKIDRDGRVKEKYVEWEANW